MNVVKTAARPEAANARTSSSLKTAARSSPRTSTASSARAIVTGRSASARKDLPATVVRPFWTSAPASRARPSWDVHQIRHLRLGQCMELFSSRRCRLDRPKQKAVVFMLNPKKLSNTCLANSIVVWLLGQSSCSSPSTKELPRCVVGGSTQGRGISCS